MGLNPFAFNFARSFPGISHPLPLPPDTTEAALHSWLAAFRLDGGPAGELAAYLDEDFRRFVHTLGLVPDTTGRLLEIGANPYFTSILLKKYRRFDLSCTNYFGIDGGGSTQVMRHDGTRETFEFPFMNNNVEVEDIPFDGLFDVVLFCEVIEHLARDPMAALLRIKEKLAPDGYLVLSTPNVCRLENVARMLCGANLYDPLSGYGVYGRHNREYNKHELHTLLTHLGFEVELIFASDVHENHATEWFPGRRLARELRVIKHRIHDLGQYIFIRARNVRPATPGKPRWLYRSYPAAEMAG